MWQGDWSNVQLQSPRLVNEVDQCLNWSARKESFPVKIVVGIYFFDISEFECDKQFPFYSPVFLGEYFQFKNYFCNNEL